MEPANRIEQAKMEETRRNRMPQSSVGVQVPYGSLPGRVFA